eukprot:SAG31_NODE_5371_length_2580_cov_3.768239_2_plen_393_part_00
MLFVVMAALVTPSFAVDSEKFLLVEPAGGEQLSKQRRTLGWAAQTAAQLGRRLVLPELRVYDVGGQQELPVPFDEIFDVMTMKAVSSTWHAPVLTFSEFRRLRARKSQPTFDYVLELQPFCGRSRPRWVAAKRADGGWDGELFGVFGLTATNCRCESMALPSLLEALGGSDPTLHSAKAVVLADTIFQLPALAPPRRMRSEVGWATLAALKPVDWIESAAKRFAQQHQLQYGSGHAGETIRPYAAIHWRRGDFVQYRRRQPMALVSPSRAANGAIAVLRKARARVLVLATGADTDPVELREFELALHAQWAASHTMDGQLEVLRTKLEDIAEPLLPPVDLRPELAEQGLALVDQMLCMNAAAFAGTATSLFSYTIHEKRQSYAVEAAPMIEL